MWPYMSTQEPGSIPLPRRRKWVHGDFPAERAACYAACAIGPLCAGVGYILCRGRKPARMNVYRTVRLRLAMSEARSQMHVLLRIAGLFWLVGLRNLALRRKRQGLLSAKKLIWELV
ncbi:hypothetical protein K432DRAFT_77535 [Lepidopterella palustris CBS 459.81]|uniref:Uncharacterized protein n=1 Tax=Lepidopterella palustris CBS 459.81 TaxID=1314670 RepID=A0A8E2EJ81_9PEZI|nr:hypothetical protein K432DRAFT_77535 [Lepidopterella palustris CBS 459.81]